MTRFSTEHCRVVSLISKRLGNECMWWKIAREVRVQYDFLRWCGTYLIEQHPIDSKWPGPWFNIKMSSYQYMKSHCGYKTVVRSSYLHNGISYTGQMSPLYRIGAQIKVVIHAFSKTGGGTTIARPYLSTRVKSAIVLVQGNATALTLVVHLLGEASKYICILYLLSKF